MTTHYKITILKSGATLKLTYRGGKFLRIEKLSGKITDLELQYLGRIIPPQEVVLNDFKNTFKETLSYTQITKPASLYTQCLDEWFAFYERTTGIKPRFNAADGKALKQIISYLLSLDPEEAQAFALWKLILDQWQELEEFYKNNTDLKFINSQINKIIQNVQRNRKAQTGGLDAEYIERIAQDLQP